MTSLSIKDFDAAMNLGATNKGAVSKLVKAWEAKNGERAKRAAGLGLMAVSLAACGGSDEVVTPTVTITQMIASDDLPASYNVAIASVNAGALTIAQLENVSEEVLAALNVEAFDAALEAGTIDISYSIADTAANILAAGADYFDDEVSVVVTNATVTLSAANLAVLEAIGVTFAGDVTVSDTAANILASSADMSEAAVVVTDASLNLTVAQYDALVELGATFVSPDITDTLDNVDGAALDGIANLTISIASETAGADAYEAAIDATGTGTVTFNFADTDDVVTLTGSLDGFSTVAVRFGTVDLTGVALDDSIDVITVSSGVILTAAQFLALEDGIEGGSADSTVQIVINDADEAADVLAALANLGGTLDASMVDFVRAEGSVLTDVAMGNLNDALDAELNQRDSADALPQALAVLDAANAAVAANDEAIADFLVSAFSNEFVEAAARDVDGDGDGELEAEDVIVADIGEANDAAAVVFRGAGQGAAFNALTDAQQAAEITLARLNLQATVDTAQEAVDTAAEALEFGVVNLIELAEAALAAKEEADTAATTAADNVTADLAAANALLQGAAGDAIVRVINGAVTTYEFDPVAQGANNTPVLAQVDGVWTLDAGVTLEDGVYTIGANGPTLRAAELDALIEALNAQVVADAAATEADTDLLDAVNAVLVAQREQAVNQVTLNNGEIDYSLAQNNVLDTYADAVRALTAADEALTEFNDAVTAWEATDALADQLAALTATGAELADAQTAARDAITDTLADGGLGINIVQAAGGTVSFDGAGAVNELYVFSSGDAQAGTIRVGADFGVGATDRIYFGEDAYTLVTLDEDIDVTESLGSAAALEIFAFEDEAAGTVTLYVEGVATAGNGTTAADITAVALTGVSLADFSFSSMTNILVASDLPA